MNGLSVGSQPFGGIFGRRKYGLWVALFDGLKNNLVISLERIGSICERRAVLSNCLKNDLAVGSEVGGSRFERQAVLSDGLKNNFAVGSEVGGG